MTRLIVAALVWSLAAVSGCAVGPDYRPAPMAAPEAWQAAGETSNSALADSRNGEDAAALARWWTWFDDATLNALIDTALAQNLDVRAAQARIHAARGERRAAQAGVGPQVGVSAGSQRLQNPMPGLAPGLTFSLHEIGFDARWELDLFGRQKRRVETADAVVAASQAELDGARTALCAELARSYWELRATDAQIALTHEAVELHSRDAQHAKRLASAGVGTREAALGADSQLAVAQSRLAKQQLARGVAQRQIERLLAVEPGQLTTSLATRATVLPQFAPRLLLTPTAVLRNRPDIQRAERQLAAATALKGAAMADMYPRVSLAMFFGLRNTALSGLMTLASKSWSAGGSVLQPLFDHGRLRAMVDVNDAHIERAMVEYERATLTALHETEDALALWLTAERERDAQALALTDHEAILALVMHRQRQGLAGAQEVIGTQLAVLAARGELRHSESRVTGATIAVLKALGAGITRDDNGPVMVGVAGDARPAGPRAALPTADANAYRPH